MKLHKSLVIYFCIVFVFILTLIKTFGFTPVVEKQKPDQISRNAEFLDRGGYAVKINKGNFISWRILGNEPIQQKFDIYKNGKLLVKNLDAINYIDKKGLKDDKYAVVASGEVPTDKLFFNTIDKNHFDIKLDSPPNSITPTGRKYSYFASELSVGDVNGDGIYEYFVLWNPTNYKDNRSLGYTGNVYIDCYNLNGQKLWRIDLGKNIRAGAHYVPFIVYDFDGDGKAEIAIRTAPGSKDGAGKYVSKAGKNLIWQDSETKEIFNDESDLRGHKYPITGIISKGPDWLTMFDGKTGKAIQTINYYPQRSNTRSWGDIYGNRSERFLAGVAYLDGKHPSLIMSRGYYRRAAMAAYDWDGKDFKILWTRDDKYRHKNLYGNGNHQLSVCDADNDGKDEIVFGSTVVNNDGSILNSTNHGHGDALQVSDFDNDGEQEVFQVHETVPYYYKYGAEIRKAKNAQIITAIPSNKDVGRGVIGNFYDGTEPSLIFTSINNNNNLYNYTGKHLSNIPQINPAFVVWWDGDLQREFVYNNQIYKLKKSFINKYNIQEIEEFENVKQLKRDVPLLQADLFGDWREEICYSTKNNKTLRIFFTTYPTKYKIPTLMHDTQYRTSVAMQNAGYNQPPYPKFYIGKKALGKNKRYLNPATGFDNIELIKLHY